MASMGIRFLMADRLSPDFFEADEEGYLQSTEEVGTDDFAKGVELALYIPDPWHQATGDAARDARVTNLPQDGYPQWLEARYPALDFDFSADEHSTASVYADYQEDETTDELIGRLADTPDFVRIRNEGTIFYHLLDAWAEHVGVDLYPTEEVTT